MSDREILQYINRNLIISRAISYTIEESDDEQKLHIERASIAALKIFPELSEKLNQPELTIEQKRELIWKVIRKKKFIKFLKLVNFLKYPLVIFILALTLNKVITLLRPHNSWTAIFYSNIELRGEPIFSTELKELSFDWKGEAPFDNVDSSNFSAKFETCLVLDHEQTLNFKLGSDDGSRLIIDKNTVIENWKIQGYHEISQSLNLSSGSHLVEIDYFQSGGASRIELHVLDQNNKEINTFKNTAGVLNSCKK